MKYIQLGFFLTDELGIKSILIDQNNTGLPNDSKLLENIAFAILKASHINRDSLILQDLLNELDISLPKRN
jgi:hypothetical protein